MSEFHNIFLVGLMGVGKTSIGKCLAKKFNLTFYDSDQVIVERAGADIHWIFDVEGEEAFRDREEAVVHDLAQMKNIVLATGGGVIVRANNREALKKNGIVIHLHAGLEELARRTRYGKTRPLLRVDNRLEKLEKLYKEREPLYREVADFSYRTDQVSLQHICQQIVDDIKTKKLFALKKSWGQTPETGARGDT